MSRIDHNLGVRGFSLVEAMLAASLLALLVTAFVGSLLYGEQGSQLGGARSRGAMLAEESAEALRSMHDSTFLGLSLTASTGLSTSSNQWIFSGTQDLTDIFTRAIAIASSTRGTGIRLATTTVTWTQNQQRAGSATVETIYTNWRGCRGGILVYGDGGTTADAIKYRVLKSNDQWDCTWSAAAATADVDGATTNKALRSVALYASATRDEKVMLSRQYDGTSQYIYAQVWNGNQSTWGSVQLLSNWSAATFLDVRNFDGTYLANGDFMAVYSDNTTVPKARIWNGSTWSAAISLQTTTGIPNYIVARARPGTNEVMAAFFNQANDTQTEYFSGGTYVTANWTLHATHAANAPLNTERLVDFAWSPNNALIGGLVFTDSATDKSLDIKIWTANGTGGGSWSALVNTTNQANNIGAVMIAGRPGANEFIACDKDALNPPRIICYRSDFTPTWTSPTNNTLVSGTDAGIQRSYAIGFESVSGDPAIAVYSDRTTVPKLKKYTAATATWDAAATSLSTIGSALKTVDMTPYPKTDEIMVLMGDTNNDLYSAVWDGANTLMYTTPSGYALATHGTNGSATTDFWYDFAWDAF